jgi:hypothetical protein
LGRACRGKRPGRSCGGGSGKRGSGGLGGGAILASSFPLRAPGRFPWPNGGRFVWGGGPKRTRVVGVFPGEGSLVNLATVVMLRATEDWAFRRYLDMGPLWAAEEKPTKIAT